MTTLEVKKNKESFQSAFDYLMEGCQIIGFDWKYQYLNDAAIKQSRRTKEELQGKRFMDAWPGSEQTELYRAMLRCMEERIPHSMETKFVFLDGSTGWFYLRIEPVPAGIVILSVDLTGRKKAEDALRESEENFRNVFDRSVTGKSITSIDGKIKTNMAFRQMLGYSEAELAQKRWQDLTHPDDIEKDLNIINSILAGDKHYMRWEKRYIHRNGRLKAKVNGLRTL